MLLEGVQRSRRTDDDGRLFHTRAAATPNARSPTVRHRAGLRGTISLWVGDDCRRCRELLSVGIRSGALSQRSFWSNGVAWSCRQLYLSAWRAFIYDGTLSSFLYYSET